MKSDPLLNLIVTNLKDDIRFGSSKINYCNFLRDSEKLIHQNYLKFGHTHTDGFLGRMKS